MGSVAVTDFKYGIDRRRPRDCGVPGTLWDGQNVHITRGGDVETPKKFVSTYALPAGTFGMVQAAGQLYTFGTADLAGSMPIGVQYQRFTTGVTGNMSRVYDAKAAFGQVYVIFETDAGFIYHGYNGALVTDWTTLATTNATVNTLATFMGLKLSADSTISTTVFGASVLLTATVPGTPFTLTTSTVNGGGVNDQTLTASTVVANVVMVPNTDATGTLTVTGGSSAPGVNNFSAVLVGATNLLAAPVDWTISNAGTATALAAAINSAGVGGYSASAADVVVTIYAPPSTGATQNGLAITATVPFGVNYSSTAMAGGVSAVAAVAQVSKLVFGGTFEPLDQFTAVLNGVSYTTTGLASATGTTLFVHKNRVYSASNTLLYYCKLNTPNNWSDAGASSGAGFINVSSLVDGNERIQSVSTYLGYAAIFTSKTVIIYLLNQDATAVSLFQQLENVGTYAPRATLSFGSTDVFYLDATGIRSLRARDASNAAIMNDVGTAIDPLIQSWVAQVGNGVASNAVAAIEPLDSRYWVAIGSRIFILSYFPTAQISAWTYYDAGHTFTDFARIGNKIFARAGDVIYLYGGALGATYPASGDITSNVQLPFISASGPATFKEWTGFDTSCQGAWDVVMTLDPNDWTQEAVAGLFTEVTYNGAAQRTIGRAPMFAPNFTSTAGGKQLLSNFVAHFDEEETN